MWYLRWFANSVIGAILSLFLAADGGPREGAIRLPPEKITTDDTIPEEPTTPVEEPISTVNSLKQRLTNKVSGYFAKRGRAGLETSPSRSVASPPVPLSSSVRQNSSSRIRSHSRTSRADGSAYGYSTSYRNRLASNAGQGLAGRRGSLASAIARRRQSRALSSGTAGEGQGNEGAELNFAQRLLMANEFAVTNIADLWVAAAINADNEDVFLSDSEINEGEEDPFQDEDEDEEQSPTVAGRAFGGPAQRSLGIPSPQMGRLSTSSVRRPSDAGVPQLRSPRRPSHRQSIGQIAGTTTDSPRRVSSSVPAIFSHTGVRTPPNQEQTPSAQPLLPREGGDVEAGLGEGLAPIIEDRRQSVFAQREQEPVDEPLQSNMSGKQPSIISQLPILIILQ